MNNGFLNLPAKVATSDGRNVVFLEPLYFSLDGKLYRIPVGATSDGASTPFWLWPLIAPFGKHWPAATGHDADYQATLEMFVPADPHLKFIFTNAGDALPQGKWVRLHTREYFADRLILKLMAACGVPVWKRYAMYYALRACGFIAFHQDRLAAKVRKGRKRVIPNV